MPTLKEQGKKQCAYVHARAAKNISKCLLRRGTVCHQKVPIISRTLTVLMFFKKGLLEKYPVSSCCSLLVNVFSYICMHIFLHIYGMVGIEVKQ